MLIAGRYCFLPLENKHPSFAFSFLPFFFFLSLPFLFFPFLFLFFFLLFLLPSLPSSHHSSPIPSLQYGFAASFPTRRKPHCFRISKSRLLINEPPPPTTATASSSSSSKPFLIILRLLVLFHIRPPAIRLYTTSSS